VQSIIDTRPAIHWKPYLPNEPATLPLCAKGLDWSRYLTALGYNGADPKLRCSG
jgi:hypothetical protein